MVVIVQRLLISIIWALPRLIKLIKRYYIYIYGKHKNIKQKNQSDKSVISSCDFKRHNEIREDLSRALPYAYLLLVGFVLPAMIFTFFYVLIRSALPHFLIAITILSFIFSWIAEQIGVKPKPLILPPLEEMDEILTEWAYRLILHIKDILPAPIRMPISRREVLGSPTIIQIEGIERLQFYVPLLADKWNQDLDLEDVKELLQSALDNLLADNMLFEQPYFEDEDGNLMPIIKIERESIFTIATISREKLRLTVTAFWVDSPEKASQVKIWRNSVNYVNRAGGEIDVTDRDY